MNTIVNTDTSGIAANDSTKRMLVMLSASLSPVLLAIVLTGLFYLVGDYQVVERAPPTSKFASIVYPESNKPVDDHFTATGNIKQLPVNTVAYLMIERDGLFWPKKNLGQSPGEWSKAITEKKKQGSKLRLVVLAISPANIEVIDKWYITAKKTGKYPGIKPLESAQEIASVEVKQQ